MASMIDDQAETIHDYIPPVKLKKTIENVRQKHNSKHYMSNVILYMISYFFLFSKDDHNDLYCFECHTEGDVICCDSCSRVYHSKCLGLVTLPDGDWTCPECQVSSCNGQTRKKAFSKRLFSINESFCRLSLFMSIQIIQCTSMSAESSRTIWNHHSTQEFHTMLKFAIRRMKSHPQVCCIEYDFIIEIYLFCRQHHFYSLSIMNRFLNILTISFIQWIYKQSRKVSTWESIRRLMHSWVT